METNKVIAVFLSLSLLLCGCGGGKDNPKSETVSMAKFNQTVADYEQAREQREALIKEYQDQNKAISQAVASTCTDHGTHQHLEG